MAARFCSACGQCLSPGFAFCPGCGSRIIASVVPSQRFEGAPATRTVVAPSDEDAPEELEAERRHARRKSMLILATIMVIVVGALAVLSTPVDGLIVVFFVVLVILVLYVLSRLEARKDSEEGTYVGFQDSDEDDAVRDEAPPKHTARNATVAIVIVVFLLIGVFVIPIPISFSMSVPSSLTPTGGVWHNFTSNAQVSGTWSSNTGQPVTLIVMNSAGVHVSSSIGGSGTFQFVASNSPYAFVAVSLVPDTVSVSGTSTGPLL